MQGLEELRACTVRFINKGIKSPAHGHAAGIYQDQHGGLAQPPGQPSLAHIASCRISSTAPPSQPHTHPRVSLTQAAFWPRTLCGAGLLGALLALCVGTETSSQALRLSTGCSVDTRAVECASTDILQQAAGLGPLAAPEVKSSGNVQIMRWEIQFLRSFKEAASTRGQHPMTLYQQFRPSHCGEDAQCQKINR